MPKFPKILTIIFLSFIIIQTGAFLFINLLYEPTKAKIYTLDEVVVTGTPYWKNPFDSLQIKIPGMKKFSEATECPNDPTKMCVPWIGEYISGIYKYTIGIVGILAAVVLMIGGIIWLTAGGSATRIGEAKAWIGASLTGLVIALCSYMILYQINPSLTQFSPIKVTDVYEDEDETEKGCCEVIGDCYPDVTESFCEESAAGYINWESGSNYGCSANNECIEVKGCGADIKISCGGSCGGFSTSGIKGSQCSDASPSLTTFLKAFWLRAKPYNPKITSISDDSGLNRCRDNYSKPPCAHKNGSCHYGCGSMDGS